MFNLFKPSKKSLFKSAYDDYTQITNSINELLAKPYSYTRFCLKRQLELELIDLSIVMSHTDTDTPKDIYRPITLIPTTHIFRILISKRESLLISNVLNTLKRHQFLPENREQLYQSQIFDKLFPIFAKYPFMTIEIFWGLLNYQYMNNVTVTALPQSYFTREPYDSPAPTNNQGDLYDYYIR